MATKRQAPKVPGTKSYMIAEIANRGMTKRQCYEILRSLVEAQESPWIFTRNVRGGSRVAKPISEQLIELKNEIGRVYEVIGRSQSKHFDSEEIPHEEIPETEIPETEDSDDGMDEGTEEIPEYSPTETPMARGKKKIEDEFAKFVREMRRIRRFCIERARTDDPVDAISGRPMETAAKLIPAGISADALLLAMTMHWSPGTREDAGIDKFDFNVEGTLTPHPEFVRISREIMRERNIEQHGKHCLFGYALVLAENRVPMMLIGPAGTGKSYLVKQLAKYMETTYAETPMSAGASRGDLLGRHTVSEEMPFVTAEFEKQYRDGGFFNFEELDRADPSVVVTLNNALASEELFNSIAGRVVMRSENFIACSTANTFGIGANASFTTAEKMDAAVMDRFRMGRMYVPIDERMEDEVFRPRF